MLRFSYFHPHLTPPRIWHPWNFTVTTSRKLAGHLWSQCSTVRATIKVNGKHLILGTRRPQTLWPIDLKFDVGDYVGGTTPTPKIVKIGPAGPPRHRGEISCSNVFFYFFIFFMTSCAPLESTFFTVSLPFLRLTTCFGGDWFPRGFQLRHQNFSPSKPQKTSILWTSKIFGLNAL